MQVSHFRPELLKAIPRGRLMRGERGRGAWSSGGSLLLSKWAHRDGQKRGESSAAETTTTEGFAGYLRIAHTVGNVCSPRSWRSWFSPIIEVCDGSFCPEKCFYLLNDVRIEIPTLLQALSPQRSPPFFGWLSTEKGDEKKKAMSS